MLTIRRIGLAVLAAAAIGIFFGMAPTVASDEAGEAYSISISSAEFRYELNAENTESAPQQQVVNGWYANDLLNIIALENARTASQSSDDRTAALLVVGILAIALWGITSIPDPKTGSLPAPTTEPTTEPTAGYFVDVG